MSACPLWGGISDHSGPILRGPLIPRKGPDSPRLAVSSSAVPLASRNCSAGVLRYTLAERRRVGAVEIPIPFLVHAQQRFLLVHAQQRFREHKGRIWSHIAIKRQHGYRQGRIDPSHATVLAISNRRTCRRSGGCGCSVLGLTSSCDRRRSRPSGLLPIEGLCFRVDDLALLLHADLSHIARRAIITFARYYCSDGAAFQFQCSIAAPHGTKWPEA